MIKPGIKRSRYLPFITMQDHSEAINVHIELLSGPHRLYMSYTYWDVARGYLSAVWLISINTDTNSARVEWFNGGRTQALPANLCVSAYWLDAYSVQEIPVRIQRFLNYPYLYVLLQRKVGARQGIQRYLINKQVCEDSEYREWWLCWESR